MVARAEVARAEVARAQIVEQGVLRMRNRVRAYPWGSRTLLAGLRGEPSTVEPEAEVWIGAHPDLPSSVVLPDGSARSLAELVRTEPDTVLGPRVREEHDARLPYLVKLLAAERPLSVQLHPPRTQAAAGYAREQAAGMPAGDPDRSYHDPYAKPELLVALSPIATLAGVRQPAEAYSLLREVGADVAERLVGADASLGCDGVAVLGGLLRWPAGELVELVRRAAAAAERLADPAAAGAPATNDPWTWVRRLAGAHAGDPAVLVPLVLELSVLAPGEAVFVPPGVVHCHLHGLGVEVMEASDNVLRAGLTNKKVDVSALLDIARHVESPPLRVAPRQEAPDAVVWDAPTRTFRLRRLDVGALRRPLDRSGGPEVLLCTSGVARLRSRSGELSVAAGESAFVPAAAEGVSVSGPASVFWCTVGGTLGA